MYGHLVGNEVMCVIKFICLVEEPIFTIEKTLLWKSAINLLNFQEVGHDVLQMDRPTNLNVCLLFGRIP